jgi:hypothetical protein
MERYASPEPLAVPTWEDQPGFARADLEFHGLGHEGDSYEGRVFLNAPEADLATPTESDSGYAGSFYVFGHGPCYGDEGHCEVPSGPIHPFDYRRPHPLYPQVMVLPITEALRRLIQAGASRLTVTVVPTNAHGEAIGDVLFFERLALVTYD